MNGLLREIDAGEIVAHSVTIIYDGFTIYSGESDAAPGSNRTFGSLRQKGVSVSVAHMPAITSPVSDSCTEG